jgi:hypothetical protein
MTHLIQEHVKTARTSVEFFIAMGMIASSRGFHLALPGKRYQILPPHSSYFYSLQKVKWLEAYVNTRKKAFQTVNEFGS